MKIAFIGDVHGHVRHALGALVLLQQRRGIRLDAAIQVGDMGAYPAPDRMDAPSRRFAAENPAEHDFFRLLDPSPEFATAVLRARRLVPPVLFASGNHEDFEWLAGLHEAQAAAVVPVDPFDAFRHVECGHVTTVAGQRIAFLGRIEEPGYMDLDATAHALLLTTTSGTVDILVTHDGPFGLCQDRRGATMGSPKLSSLITHLQPRLHVSGHYHHENGPRRYGRTASYTLAELVNPKVNRHRPERANPRQRVTPGSIALLDTDTYAMEYLHDDWLAEVCGDDYNLAAAVDPASTAN
jgi:Icc-related predicted phosphoesterase